MSLITVHTDQGPQQLAQGSTVADLLTLLSQRHARDTQAVATAVNGEFVPRSERDHYILKEGDTLLCFAAITGG